MDLSSAHPQAYGGPCNRVTFKKGRKYAFFLSYDDDGDLSLLGFPFSRVSEDYYGDESLWGRTIQYYLEVQTLDDRMQELEVLKEKYEMLTATELELRDNKLAADIADHLMSRSPYKPTEYLLWNHTVLLMRNASCHLLFEVPLRIKKGLKRNESPSMFLEMHMRRVLTRTSKRSLFCGLS